MTVSPQSLGSLAGYRLQVRLFQLGSSGLSDPFSPLLPSPALGGEHTQMGGSHHSMSRERLPKSRLHSPHRGEQGLRPPHLLAKPCRGLLAPSRKLRILYTPGTHFPKETFPSACPLSLSAG